MNSVNGKSRNTPVSCTFKMEYTGSGIKTELGYHPSREAFLESNSHLKQVCDLIEQVSHWFASNIHSWDMGQPSEDALIFGAPGSIVHAVLNSEGLVSGFTLRSFAIDAFLKEVMLTGLNKRPCTISFSAGPAGESVIDIDFLG